MSHPKKADINSAKAPKEKILQQNSTHKAVANGDQIDIYIKGFTDEDTTWPDEYLYSIPKADKDDLFAIFEDLDETNRCNLAEANAEFAGMSDKQIQDLINWAKEEKIPAAGQQPPAITEHDEKALSVDPDVLAARGEILSAEMQDARETDQEDLDQANHPTGSGICY